MGLVENWRPVPGFEGRYSVSDLGRVFSHRINRCLRPGRMSGGHVSVALGRRNSRCVHELVLTTFVGPRPPKAVSRHLNGESADNRLDNLVWATYSDNGRDKKWHKGQSTYKLPPDQVRQIRLRNAAGESVSYLSGLYGVCRNTIRNVVGQKHHIDVN